MNGILDEIELFCKKEVVPYLSSTKGQPDYPASILRKMGEIGLFGINIPEEFGGSKLPISLNLQVNRIISKYWLALPALYGTHLRANQYFLELGTAEQKSNYLPQMASGESIVAHAYHEKAIKDPLKFRTQISEKDGKFFLSGTKEWVTNARDCDFMIVVARNLCANQPKKSMCSAVIIDKKMEGVSICDEHHRRGIEGVSLARVNFNNVHLDESSFIGGSKISALEFISSFRPISSLNFAARCAGVAETLVEMTKPYLMLDERNEEAKGVIYYKWSEIQMIKESISSYFEQAVVKNREGNLSKSDAHRTKVFCSQSLESLVSKVRMLCGGTGYASDDFLLVQQLNDAGSLSLIDTPNDILLTWSGKDDLNGS